MMPKTGIWLLVLGLALGITASQVGAQNTDRTASWQADQAVLRQGVTEIAAPGLPGPVAVFGPNAFPVIVGRSGALAAPVVAASFIDRGKVVVFGHPGYLDSQALTTADTGKLVLNAVRWLAQPGKPLRVGVRQRPDLAAYLIAKGITVDRLEGSRWTDQLKKESVISCPLADLSPTETAALESYLRGGGGLLAAELGWGWLQLNPGKTLTQHGGNRLLGQAGLLWADGSLDRTSPNGFLAGTPPSAVFNASTALDMVLAGSNATPMAITPPNENAQAVETTLLAARTLPPGDKILLPRLESVRTQHQSDPALRLTQPLTQREPLARLLLTLEVQRAMHLPVSQVPALPAAATFPGLVPAAAPRVTHTIEIDTVVPGWHSTGLYAAPGEAITVSVPPQATRLGLEVRIGAHTDTLWQLAKWERAPEITRTFPIHAVRTPAANAFGGPVYIVVPENCKAERLRVTVDHAVEAPLFVRGQTDLTAWRQTIRQAPAPWAELQGNNVILTVPSDVVRTLDDPEGLMALWDRVLDTYADFAGIPHHRLRPERYCTDKQISAGYMHSGYPIMTGLDVAADFVNAHLILTNGDGKSKSWGFFHEMGHNHQQPDWTFEGTGEVTNNVFGLYVLDTVCGVTAHQHPALEPDVMQARLQKYVDGGADFAQWKNDPFLALTMYIELQKGFGWDAYKKVFAEYHRLPDAQRPKTDAEKRDQWMVRFSRTVGHNLGPFFQAWGVPTSPEARASIAGLPAWMPPNFPAPLRGAEKPTAP